MTIEQSSPVIGTSMRSDATSGKAKNTLVSSGSSGMVDDHDAVDHELEDMMNAVHSTVSRTADVAHSRKNNKQMLEWDEEMEEMQRAKIAAEAMRGAKFAFRFCRLMQGEVLCLCDLSADLKTRLQGSKQIRQPGVPPSSITTRNVGKAKVFTCC